MKKNIIRFCIINITLFFFVLLPTNVWAEGFPVMMDIRKFTYTAPNPLVTMEEIPPQEKTQNLQGWWTPFFTVKGCNDVAYANVNNCKLEVTPKVNSQINGTAFLKLSALKIINDKKSQLSRESCKPLIAKAEQILGSTNIINIPDYYAFIPHNYYSFLNFWNNMNDCAKNSGFTASEILEILGDDKYITFTFFAGIANAVPANDSNFSPETIKSFATTWKNDTLFDYNNLTNDAYNSYKKFAGGACYTITKEGKKNTCTNVPLFRCEEYKQSLGENAAYVHFAYGLSCQGFDELLEFDASKTQNKAERQAEIIGAQANKEIIPFKPQVTFAGIKEGIDLAEYINEIYKYLMVAALVITGIILTIGGAKYIIKGKEGLPMIKNALIGLLLLTSSYLILSTINPDSTSLEIISINEVTRVGETSTSGGTGETDISNADVSDTKITEKSKLPYNDAFGFKLPELTSDELSKCAKVELWNTHYYTLYKGDMAPEKSGKFIYPLVAADEKTVIAWVDAPTWCAAAMEGSIRFSLNGQNVTVSVAHDPSKNKTSPCGSNRFPKLPLDKKVEFGLMDDYLATLKEQGLTTCGPTPAKLIPEGQTPKCSWWSTHPTSLYQVFSAPKNNKVTTFGGAGMGGGVIPLRSLAVRRSSSAGTNVILRDHYTLGVPGAKSLGQYGYKFLVYIPDARGVKATTPSGEIITHDGYFWINDSGGLSGAATPQLAEKSSKQIDIFTGTIKQKILDGQMHDAYVVPVTLKPELYEKFRQIEFGPKIP